MKKKKKIVSRDLPTFFTHTGTLFFYPFSLFLERLLIIHSNLNSLTHLHILYDLTTVYLFFFFQNIKTKFSLLRTICAFYVP